jgi:hypothetical protein
METTFILKLCSCTIIHVRLGDAFDITHLGCSEFEIPTFAVYAPLSKTNTSLLVAILHFLQFNYGFLPAMYFTKQHHTHTQYGRISDITGSAA